MCKRMSKEQRAKLRATRASKRKAVQVQKGKGPNLNSAGAISTTIATALMLSHLLHSVEPDTEKGE
jgi:hypothetical protein